MTDKELMYVDDALSHARFLQKQCTDCANMLTDQSLKAFVTELGSKHGEIFGSLYGLL